MSDRGAGLPAVLPLLVCPHCTRGLEWTAPGIAGCSAGHRFDVARRGYLPLLAAKSRTDTGDSADMVAARVDFLDAAHYLPIADAVAAHAVAGPVLDIGAGTGYYLAAALRRLDRFARGESGQPGPGLWEPGPKDPGQPEPGSKDPGLHGDRSVGVALDASRYSAGRSASAHPGIGSVLADAWSRLPVRSGVFSTVLSVFAPRDPAEITRVLAPEGRLVVVTPEPDHLSEIRGQLGLLVVDPGKSDRLDVAFAGLLSAADRIGLRRQLALSPKDVHALVRMGPSARHLRPDHLERAISGLSPQTTVTMSVTISVLQRS